MQNDEPLITIALIKHALDNCVWEHGIARGQTAMPPDAWALGQLYSEMSSTFRAAIPFSQAPPAVREAIARWKDHVPASPSSPDGPASVSDSVKPK